MVAMGPLLALACMLALLLAPIVAASQTPRPSDSGQSGAAPVSLASKAASRGDCAVPEGVAHDRPAAGGAATSIAVGVRLLDVIKIDDVGEAITANFVVVQQWTDPRLVGLMGCRVTLADIWTPGLTILNSGQLMPLLPDFATIGSGGAVKHVQRYQGPLAFRHRLEDFPFDAHVVRISLLPVTYPHDQVVVAVDERVTGRDPVEFTIPDWIFGEAHGRVSSLTLKFLDQVHSQYDLEVPAKRRADHFVIKVVVPLVLIVAMSWTVFWVTPSRFGPQIGTSAAAMLTLIAFHFAMQSILPPINYTTVLDRFILASTVLVFLAMVEAVMTSFLVAKERSDIAQRLDVHCRWLFPAAFFAMACVVFFPLAWS